MAGKGSTPRPIQIPRDEFTRRWEAAFGGQSTEEAAHELVRPAGERIAKDALGALLDKQEREIAND